MPKPLDIEAVIALIRGHVDRAGSMRALAREWGTTHVYLSLILSGQRFPGPTILGKLGLERMGCARYARVAD